MLRDYILGRLSPEQRDRVEENYVADENFHEELLAVESELIDSYVRGELSTEEGYYLLENLGPDGRDRIAFARTLETVKRRSESEREVPSSIHWFTRGPLFRRVIFAAASLAAVVIVARIAVKRWSPTQVASIPSPPAVTPIEQAAIVAVLFPIEVERAAKQAPEPSVVQGPPLITLPREGRPVSLRLMIPPSAEYSAYVAKVDALDGSWSNTFHAQPAQTVAGEKILELKIDSAQLKSRDYKITVSGVQNLSEEFAAGYRFQVKRE